jgi:hypothetical protein
MEKVISPSALRELAAWEAIATKWEWYIHPDTYLRCRECHQGVARMADRHGANFSYNEAELLALKVAHIRQIHSEIFNGNVQEAN